MGRGRSKGGGAGAVTERTAPRATYEDEVENLAQAMVADYDRENEYPMSNSDLEAAVEAYAMTHKGVDENEMLEAVRDRVQILEGGRNNAATRYSVANASAGTRSAAEEITEMSRTTAFPSSQAVVKRVQPLQDMQDAMNRAPVTTTVAFQNGNTTRIFEKVGATTWKSTDVVKSGNTYSQKKSASLKGIKALQSVVSEHYSSSHDPDIDAIRKYVQNTTR